MKKIEKGTKKYLIILIIAVALCGIILYPLLDLIYYKLIVNSDFTYSIYRHIIQPIIFASAFGTTFWLIDKKRK